MTRGKAAGNFDILFGIPFKYFYTGKAFSMS